jgi:hypothetical protein
MRSLVSSGVDRVSMFGDRGLHEKSRCYFQHEPLHLPHHPRNIEHSRIGRVIASWRLEVWLAKFSIVS